MAMSVARSSVLFLILALTACAQDPGRRWLQASTIMTETNHQVVDLHELGILGDHDLIQMEPYLNTANSAVNKARIQLRWDGNRFIGGSTFDTLMMVFDSAIDEVTRYRDAAWTGDHVDPNADKVDKVREIVQ